MNACQPPDKNQEHHCNGNQFEGREIKLAVPVQVIAYHVARPRVEFAQGAEHRAVAQSPYIHQIEYGLFPGIAGPCTRLSALRANASRVMMTAVTALALGLVDDIGSSGVQLQPMVQAPVPSQAVAVALDNL